MLGFKDFWVFLAYILCIISMVFSVIYSIMKWNREENDFSDEDLAWLKEEQKVENNI